MKLGLGAGASCQYYLLHTLSVPDMHVWKLSTFTSNQIGGGFLERAFSVTKQV